MIKDEWSSISWQRYKGQGLCCVTYSRWGLGMSCRFNTSQDCFHSSFGDSVSRSKETSFPSKDVGQDFEHPFEDTIAARYCLSLGNATHKQ